MNIYFKYTAQNTPQQNFMEDVGFSLLANKGIAMMYCEKFPTAMRYHLLPK